MIETALGDGRKFGAHIRYSPSLRVGWKQQVAFHRAAVIGQCAFFAG